MGRIPNEEKINQIEKQLLTKEVFFKVILVKDSLGMIIQSLYIQKHIYWISVSIFINFLQGCFS